MALQLGAVRDAFLDAGASPDKANAAAEELAGYDRRLATLDTKLAVLMVMVGGLYALAIPGGWLLLRMASKLGALG